MTETVIVAIVGVFGTLVAGLGAALINHLFTTKREKYLIKRQYKERRIYPLIELASNVASAYQRYDVIFKNDEESLKSIRELEDIQYNQVWKAIVQTTGIDSRIENGFKELWEQTVELEELRREAYAKKKGVFDKLDKKLEEARTILERLKKHHEGESYQELSAKFEEKIREVDTLIGSVDDVALRELYKDSEFSQRYQTHTSILAIKASNLTTLCYEILGEG